MDPLVVKWKLAREAAELAFKLYCANLFRPLYVWYVPNQERIDVAEDKPGDAYELAINERIPRNLSTEAVMHWVYERLTGLAILKID